MDEFNDIGLENLLLKNLQQYLKENYKKEFIEYANK